jgi:hypothetical protein
MGPKKRGKTLNKKNKSNQVAKKDETNVVPVTPKKSKNNNDNNNDSNKNEQTVSQTSNACNNVSEMKTTVHQSCLNNNETNKSMNEIENDNNKQPKLEYSQMYLTELPISVLSNPKYSHIKNLFEEQKANVCMLCDATRNNNKICILGGLKAQAWIYCPKCFEDQSLKKKIIACFAKYDIFPMIWLDPSTILKVYHYKLKKVLEGTMLCTDNFIDYQKGKCSYLPIFTDYAMCLLINNSEEGNGSRLFSLTNVIAHNTEVFKKLKECDDLFGSSNSSSIKIGYEDLPDYMKTKIEKDYDNGTFAIKKNNMETFKY